MPGVRLRFCLEFSALGLYITRRTTESPMKPRLPLFFFAALALASLSLGPRSARASDTRETLAVDGEHFTPPNPGPEF